MLKRLFLATMRVSKATGFGSRVGILQGSSFNWIEGKNLVIDVKHFLACTKDEGFGIAMEYLLSAYPKEKGFFEHTVTIDEGLSVEEILALFNGESTINGTSI